MEMASGWIIQMRHKTHIEGVAIPPSDSVHYSHRHIVHGQEKNWVWGWSLIDNPFSSAHLLPLASINVSATDVHFLNGHVEDDPHLGKVGDQPYLNFSLSSQCTGFPLPLWLQPAAAIPDPPENSYWFGIGNNLINNSIINTITSPGTLWLRVPNQDLWASDSELEHA